MVNLSLVALLQLCAPGHFSLKSARGPREDPCWSMAPYEGLAPRPTGLFIGCQERLLGTSELDRHAWLRSPVSADHILVLLLLITLSIIEPA